MKYETSPLAVPYFVIHSSQFLSLRQRPRRCAFFGFPPGIPTLAGFLFWKRGAWYHTPQKENPRTGNPARESNRKKLLLTEIEFLEETLIALARGALEVVQQAAAFGHHHKETAA